MAKRFVFKKPFKLESHYTSDQAKRRLASICQAVNEEGEQVGIMGTEDRPYLWLLDVNQYDGVFHRTMTIDEVRGDWTNITLGCALFRTVFRIKGKKMYRAVLIPNLNAEHGALAYRRSELADLDALADKLVEIERELRGRTNKFDDCLEKLEDTSKVIGTHFKSLWRMTNGLSPETPAH